MRTIAFIFTMLFTCQTQAQKAIFNTVTQTSSEDCACENLDDYTGTYLWENEDNEVFKMNLKKINIQSKENTIGTILIGEFFLKKDKHFIVKNKKATSKKILQQTEVNILYPQIMSVTIKNEEVILTIKDELKNKSIEGTLKKQSDGSFLLTLADKNGMNQLDFHQPVLDGLTLPKEMILTKL